MSIGFIYFIEEEETGQIKIGFSEKHPDGRLKDFQTGNSNKLFLLGFIEGTRRFIGGFIGILRRFLGFCG